MLHPMTENVSLPHKKFNIKLNMTKVNCFIIATRTFFFISTPVGLNLSILYKCVETCFDKHSLHNYFLGNTSKKLGIVSKPHSLLHFNDFSCTCFLFILLFGLSKLEMFHVKKIHMSQLKCEIEE